MILADTILLSGDVRGVVRCLAWWCGKLSGTAVSQMQCDAGGRSTGCRGYDTNNYEKEGL